MADELTITNYAMNGGHVAIPIPANTGSLAWQAKGGDIALKISVGNPNVWTLKDGEKEAFNTRVLSGKTLYALGTSPAVLQVRTIAGFLA